MAIVGSLFGLLVAIMIHALMGRLRRRWPTLAAGLGWLVTVGIIIYGVGCVEAFLVARNDPSASISPPWGVYTLSVGLLLLACVGLGFISSRHDRVNWLRAFGGVMAEAGAAIAVGLLLYEFLNPVVGLFRARVVLFSAASTDVSSSSGTDTLIYVMLRYFDLFLLVFLGLLLTFSKRQAGLGHQAGDPAS